MERRLFRLSVLPGSLERQGEPEEVGGILLVGLLELVDCPVVVFARQGDHPGELVGQADLVLVLLCLGPFEEFFRLDVGPERSPETTAARPAL